MARKIVAPKATRILLSCCICFCALGGQARERMNAIKEANPFGYVEANLNSTAGDAMSGTDAEARGSRTHNAAIIRQDDTPKPIVDVHDLTASQVSPPHYIRIAESDIERTGKIHGRSLSFAFPGGATGDSEDWIPVDARGMSIVLTIRSATPGTRIRIRLSDDQKRGYGTIDDVGYNGGDPLTLDGGPQTISIPVDAFNPGVDYGRIARVNVEYGWLDLLPVGPVSVSSSHMGGDEGIEHLNPDDTASVDIESIEFVFKGA